LVDKSKPCWAAKASLEPEQREQLRSVLLALKAQHDSEMQANRGADDVMASGEPARGFHKPLA
jgi:hypothetical protein